MTTTIDDQDRSKINYTGLWARGGTPSEYMNSVMSSTRAGDYFTVTFSGTNIAVFGTFDITSGGVVSTYAVDGGRPAEVISQAGSRDTTHQQFWRSALLTNGEHKLVVNMTKVNSDPQPGEGTIWFDYFLVTDPAISSGQPNAASPTSSSNKVGAIVGAVIGGLFFVLALAILFFLYRRRARVRLVIAEEKAEGGYDSWASAITRNKRTTVQPFVLTTNDLSPDMSSSTSASTSMSGAHPLPTPAPGVASYLISGPPPTACRKSTATIRPSPSRPGTRHSSQASLDNTELSYAPHTEDPPPIPSSSVETAQDLSGSAMVVPNKNKHKLRTARQQVIDIIAALDGVQVLSESASASGSGTPAVSTALPPVQHVDSGMRAPGFGVSNELGAERVELPPVYSPV